MLRTVLLTAALAVGATAVLAQGDPIAQRRQTMKGVGEATKIGSAMAKGEAPSDRAKATEVLQAYPAAADRLHTNFPENSKTGGETTAAPTIWQNQAEFRKRFDDWAAEIKAASAQTNNLDSFKAAFGNLTKACGGCHETFRIKKS